MPGGRRNVKSTSFKHHPSDDRHAELPKQPQAVPPKHIPVPDVPSSGEFCFELEALCFTLLTMGGQYINLYKSVFWLPNSHNHHALNFYLIDCYVVALNLMILCRRVPVCILKKLCGLCLPASYQPTYTFGIQICTLIILVPSLLFCAYNIILEHGFISLICLLYPFVVYVIVFGVNISKFLELKSPPPERTFAMKSRNGSHFKSISTVAHVCSMSAETIRYEVELLRTDFNSRWKQVLVNSFLVVYYAAFLPCYFAQNALQYDVHWVIQHGIFTGIGCFTLYVCHCFPPKYCDVLHRAALHLGRWQRIEIKNVHVPFSIWGESSIWNQGALVKHSKELFKAEGLSNAAEPGNVGHLRFYFLFKNPSTAAKLMWVLQLLLVSAELVVLIQSHRWNDLISIQLLILINCKTLFDMTRVYFVIRKIYYEESVIISRFSN